MPILRIMLAESYVTWKTRGSGQQAGTFAIGLRFTAVMFQFLTATYSGLAA